MADEHPAFARPGETEAFNRELGTNPQKDEIERVARVAYEATWGSWDEASKYDREMAVEFVTAAIAAMGRENEVLREDLGDCELCDRPLALGQFVNSYDDIGQAHCNCERPWAKPEEETPTPDDDGTVMPTYVLLGQPALLEELK